MYIHVIFNPNQVKKTFWDIKYLITQTIWAVYLALRGLPTNEAAAGGWRNCDVRLWRQDGALCVNVRLFWVCMYIVNCILCTVLALLNFITVLKNRCILTFFLYLSYVRSYNFWNQRVPSYFLFESTFLCEYQNRILYNFWKDWSAHHIKDPVLN